MVRHPLFRDEENTSQAAQIAHTLHTFVPLHAASDEEMHPKASPDDALWNRMNLAMRLSCQQSKLPVKRKL